MKFVQGALQYQIISCFYLRATATSFRGSSYLATAVRYILSTNNAYENITIVDVYHPHKSGY